MSDIRFKISGSTPTFVAKVFNNASRSTLIQQKNVNSSGTTVVFGALLANTCYYLSIHDSIGNTATGKTSTPTVCVGSVILTNKALTMGGCSVSADNFTNILDSTSSLSTNKISPILSYGESVDLVFSAKFYNFVCGGASDNVNNNITIFCKANNTTEFSPWCSLDFINTTSTVLPALSYNYGDEVCYNISTIANSSPAKGCAELSFTFENPVGFIPSLGTPYSKTTGVELIVPPITISFLPETISGGDWFSKEIGSKIYTSQPLYSGQSFTLNYTDYSNGYISGHCLVCDPITAFAYACDGGSILNKSLISLSGKDVYNTDTKHGTLNITSANIGNYCFITNVKTFNENLSCVHSLSSTIKIDSISNAIGGVYILGNDEINASITQP